MATADASSGESSKSGYSNSNLSPHVRPGYAAPFLWPVVAILLTAALCLNEYALQQQLAIPHAVIFIAALACVVVHEVLRACAESASNLALLAVRIAVSATHALIAHARRGFLPQFPGWSGLFHILQAGLKATATHHGHAVIWLHNAQIFRRNADWFGRVHGWFSCRIHGTTIEPFAHNGLEHLWLRLKDDAGHDHAAAVKESAIETTSIVVLYLHGGGYTGMSPRVYTDFCSRLSRCVRDQLTEESRTSPHKLQVLIANYRKLPEVTYPTPVDDCMVMYEYLTSQKNVPPPKIILAGDSAGAGLVLSVLLRLRDAGQQMPLGAIVLSPFVDFDGGELAADHCLIQAPVATAIRDFCRNGDPNNMNAWREAHIVDRDLSKLPPLLVQTGSFDIFHQHALRLAKKAETDGVEGLELDIHPEMPHVFSTLPAWLLPGSKHGVDHMTAFIVKRMLERGGSGQKKQAGDDTDAVSGDQRARPF